MAKVKEYQKLDKENGSVRNLDSESYQKRLQVIKNQKRLKQLEQTQQEQNNKLDQLSEQMSLIIGLLQNQKMENPK